MSDSIEHKLVAVLDPVIDSVVQLERDVSSKWAATEKLFGDERTHLGDELEKTKDLIETKVAGVEAKAIAAIESIRTGDIAELREKNADAVAFVQQSFDDLVGRIDEAVKASSAAVDAASSTARETMAPEIDALRADFNSAVLGVRKLLDEQLYTITTAARDLEDRQKLDTQRAADHLVMAASVFGA